MLEFFLNFGEIVIPALVILVGYTVGSINEKGHYKSIKKRETEFLPLPAVTMKTCLAPEEVNSAKMVVGSVVVSIDHFKRFLAVLRNFFGGRVSTYETLVDRARRAAVLRLKKDAGEAKAISAFEQAATAMAELIKLIKEILQPEMILLTGPVVNCASYLNTVQTELEAYAGKDWADNYFKPSNMSSEFAAQSLALYKSISEQELQLQELQAQDLQV